MLQLSFNQTQSELMVRAAATVVFNAIHREGVAEQLLSGAAERPQYGFTASAASEPVGPKFVRITDLQDGKIDWSSVPYCECQELDSYLLHENDLLFARTGATTGKTHLIGHSPEPAIFASYLIRLRAKAGVVPAYLYAFFQSDSYWAQIMEEKEGSAQPNVNGEKLSNIRIPMVDAAIQKAIAEFISAVRQRQDDVMCQLPELPYFLAPQKSVVSKLENVLQRVEQAKSLRRDSIALMHAFTTSRRNALFGNRPMPNWVKLSTYVSEIENGKSPQCESRPANTEEWGVLKVGAVSFGSFDERQNKALPVALKPDKRFEVHAGDFLMSRANTKELVGACAIVNRTRSHLLLCDKIFRFHFRNDVEFEAKWLDHALKAPVLREQIEQKSSGTSSTMKNISKEKVFDLLLPPHSAAEQCRIVAELDRTRDHVYRLNALQAETAKELNALVPSIVNRAFAGQL